MNRKDKSLEIVRGVALNGTADRLMLFINGRFVEANQTQVALLAMLHDEAGRVVPYKRLYSTMGHRSAGLRQRHILRQHMVGIKKALDKFKAPLALSVSKIGRASCRERV